MCSSNQVRNRIVGLTTVCMAVWGWGLMERKRQQFRCWVNKGVFVQASSWDLKCICESLGSYCALRKVLQKSITTSESPNSLETYGRIGRRIKGDFQGAGFHSIIKHQDGRLLKKLGTPNIKARCFEMKEGRPSRRADHHWKQFIGDKWNQTPEEPDTNSKRNIWKGHWETNEARPSWRAGHCKWHKDGRLRKEIRT